MIIEVTTKPKRNVLHAKLGKRRHFYVTESLFHAYMALSNEKALSYHFSRIKT